MNTYALVHTQGLGQNRVNPCSAGGGNPMRVTHSKKRGGGLVMTNRGCWVLAWIVSWTWEGLHPWEITKGSYLTLICKAFQIQGVSKSTFTGISRLALFSSAHFHCDAEVYSSFYQFMGVHLNKHVTASCKVGSYIKNRCTSTTHAQLYASPHTRAKWHNVYPTGSF